MSSGSIAEVGARREIGRRETARRRALHGRASLLTAAIMAFGLAHPAKAIVIDFEVDGLGNPLAAGTIIDDEYANLGIEISVFEPLAHPAMIFDSANPTGGDDDLGAPNEDFGGPGEGRGGRDGAPGENAVSLGNILILSEDGDANDPDDDASGGSIRISFLDPVEIGVVEVLDIDDNGDGSTISLLTANGDLIERITLAELGNNSYQSIDVDRSGVSRMVVDFESSGALVSFEAISVPEPGIAAFLLSGLLAAAWRSRSGTRTSADTRS